MRLRSWINDRWTRSKLWLEARPNAGGWFVFAFLGLGLLWLNIWQRQSERLPFTIGYLISCAAMFTLPTILVTRHRLRQQKTLNRIRALYALACEMLFQDRIAEARRLLRSIRRWEQHWHIGESGLYQLAYSWFVIAATATAGFVHYIFYINIDSQTAPGQIPQKSILETAQYLQSHPIALWLIGFFAFLIGLAARQHLSDLKGVPWAEFYGDRLASAIKAGRTVNDAPKHQGPAFPLEASAREMLGLPERFTAAELRQAWVRLARELHPDRWVAAGDGVRRLKEAALKRVNAARDELAAQMT